MYNGNNKLYMRLFVTELQELLTPSHPVPFKRKRRKKEKVKGETMLASIEFVSSINSNICFIRTRFPLRIFNHSLMADIRFPHEETKFEEFPSHICSL